MHTLKCGIWQAVYSNNIICYWTERFYEVREATKNIHGGWGGGECMRMPTPHVEDEIYIYTGSEGFFPIWICV